MKDKTMFQRTWELMQLAAHANSKAKGFWEDYDKAMDILDVHGEDVQPAVMQAFDAQKLKLMGDELAEANEALRDGNPPSVKAEGFSQLEEELADVVIRLWDFAGKHRFDIAGAIEAKMTYNASRTDKTANECISEKL